MKKTMILAVLLGFMPVMAQAEVNCNDLDLAVTTDMRECIHRKFTQSDAELNASYKKLMAALNTDEKSELKKLQVSWIKEKEKKCQAAGSQFEGGTMEAVAVDDCYLDMTIQRVDFLKNYRKLPDAQANLPANQPVDAAPEKTAQTNKIPKSTQEAMDMFNAERGDFLAGEPKIKPDGKLYAISGSISIADESGERFIGSQKVFLTLATRYRLSDYELKYFEIQITDEFRKAYLENAQVDKNFLAVGHYVENTKISLVNGQVAPIPVFKTTFFRFY